MSRRTELLALLALLAVGAALRLLQPGADVPPRAERTDAPIQDAFWYLEAAAAPAEGLPRDVEPFAIYDPPVWVHVARLWFACAGVSLGTAQALGALVSLATLLLVWRLARAALGPREGLIAAAVLATLYPFVWLSRTTLVYGPAALALTVAVALAWAGGRPAPRRGGVGLEVAAWAALGLCGSTFLELAGASTGQRASAAAALPALVAAWWWLLARRRPASARQALTALAAWAIVLTTTLALRPPAVAAAGGLALLHVCRARRPLRTSALVAITVALVGLGLMALDPGDLRAHTLDRLSRYVRADALAPGALALRALRLGGEPVGVTGSGYVSLAAGATLAAALGALVPLGRRLAPGARDLVALVGGWAALFLVGAVASDYRPLRYFAVIGPPVAVLAAVGVAGVASRSELAPGRGRLPVAVALWGALVGPHALEVIAGPRTLADLLPAAAAGAAAALGAWVIAPRLGAPTRRAVAAVVLAAATAPGALFVALDLTRPLWLTAEANAAAGSALAAEASLVGPHASVLALGHGVERRRAAWIDASPGRVEETLGRLRRLRATHLALGVQQATSSGIIDAFESRGMSPALVGIFHPRGTPVLLYRFPWAVEQGYRLSAFEQRRAGDGAGAEPTAEADPALLLARVRALAFRGRPDRARAVMAATATQTSIPSDVIAAAGRALQARGLR